MDPTSVHERKRFQIPTRIKVFCEQIVIALPNGVQQAASKKGETRGKDRKPRKHHVRLVDVLAKCALRDHVQDGRECRRLFFHRHGVVHVLVPQTFHGGRQVSKEDWRGIDARASSAWL